MQAFAVSRCGCYSEHCVVFFSPLCRLLLFLSVDVTVSIVFFVTGADKEDERRKLQRKNTDLLQEKQSLQDKARVLKQQIEVRF